MVKTLCVQVSYVKGKSWLKYRHILRDDVKQNRLQKYLQYV
jgi:hypothetical protein